MKMSASGQVEMSAFGDVVSLGSRTNGQELVRMSIKELDRVERVDRWEPRRASQRQRPGGGAPPGERGAQPRRAVIFYEGTNDITGNATFEQLKAGLQQVIDRVHAKGVAIYGGTVVPRGRPAPMTGWTGSMEAVKLATNHWIHTEANFDGIVEFGALLA